VIQLQNLICKNLRLWRLLTRVPWIRLNSILANSGIPPRHGLKPQER